MTQTAWIIQDDIKLPTEVVKGDLWMSYVRESHNIKKIEFWGNLVAVWPPLTQFYTFEILFNDKFCRTISNESCVPRTTGCCAAFENDASH